MANYWDTEELLGSVKKNKAENILVKYVTTKGKTYINLVIVKTDSEGNEKVINGMAIPVEEAPNIIALIQSKLNLPQGG